MKLLKEFLSNVLSRLFLEIEVRRDLRHSDARVRYEAVQTIGDMAVMGICNPQAFNALVTVYENRDETPRIRGDALDGIWKTNPQWLPATPGVEILEDTVNQLMTLFDQNRDGKAFTDHNVSSEPVRALGARLDIQGGFDLMLLACVRFKLQRPTAIQQLNQLWWGVGSWPKPRSSFDYVL